MNAATLADWIANMPVDQAELKKLEVAVAIDGALKSLGITRKQFAEILNTSPAWVTKVLRGDVNLTIVRMVELFDAVGLEVQIKLVAKRIDAPTGEAGDRALAATGGSGAAPQPD